MMTPMRCCKICGCYLPDNVTRCLACGFDEHYNMSPYDPDEIMTTTLDDEYNRIIIGNPIRAIHRIYTPQMPTVTNVW